jgi:PAS domain S-box-containing protein
MAIPKYDGDSRKSGVSSAREGARERTGMANGLSRQHESSQFSGSAVLNIVRLIFDRAPLSEVLTTIARLVEAQGNGMLCAIWLLDHDASQLRCAAAPSLPAEYVAQMDGAAVTPNGGSCGAAVHRKEPVYVSDILTDTLWDNYRHLALRDGLRACWSRPLFSSDGKVVGTFVSYYREVRTPSATDVQLIESASHIVGIAIERHVSEDQLRHSEARKAAILDSALDCIVTIDHEGRITEFNPAAERTFGHRRADVVGKHLADVIIPPPLRGEHQRGLARFVATGEARVIGRRVEMTAVRADGSEFPVELAITRIPLDGPPSFTGYLRDITERKRAEEELRRSEAFLAEGQRLSRTGSFSWRVATDEITWSEQLYRIFKFEPGVPVTLELIGSRVHPEDITLFTDIVARARDGGNFEYEHRLLMPDRSVKYLHVIAHATRDRDGRLEYIGAIQDVTERRLSEEALSKARSDLARVARITSLGALTASIAHEVNQPLSGIVTNASTCLRMLAADPPNIEGAVDTARRTIRDGHRASDVITRLRALFGKKDPAAEPVDLNEAAREVMALASSELQRSRVMLRPELADDLPPVNGDRVQLQQVILNLLRNAADAMSGIDDRPRQLVIRTQRDDDDGVRLTVQDAGVGFGPEIAERLFDAFYTTKTDGMGIGLSVSRSIIERHRGRLWAAPNDNGPGATFCFSIPRGAESVMGAENLTRSL